jgi:tetratricopeptide (TPR) repeat protein
VLERTRALDPLDWWSRYLLQPALKCDLQSALDLAVDYIRAGLHQEAIALLQSAQAMGDATSQKAAEANGHASHVLPDQSWGAAPLRHYYLGWLHAETGNARASAKQYGTAANLPPDYCFPARLEEIGILKAAMQANPSDARAPYYLGNLLYDRRRHSEAIQLWERAAKLDPSFSIVWRNLGIGYFNVRRQPAKARIAYNKAFQANPADARLVYERDQLWKRLGESPYKRLAELEEYPKLVKQRDDLTVELCALYNQTGRHEEAATLIRARRFQPWEGGEGGPLGQHVRSHLALGTSSLARGLPEQALYHFQAALDTPPNLGEARHLLANQSDIYYWLGCALDELGEKRSAREHWRAAATFKGDFQEMAVRSFSEMTYFSAMSWMRLGRKSEGKRLLKQLLDYARRLAVTPAKIDYFATSLPTMLLFEDDLQARQETIALFLQAQALLGLKRKSAARRLFKEVLRRDPNHALAADHLRES